MSEGLDALLVQQARQGERLAELGQRLTEVSGRLGDLSQVVQGLRGTQADQAQVLGSLDGLADMVRDVVRRFNALVPPEKDDGSQFYQPEPARRWWQLRGEQRDQAVAELARWVDGIYFPSFGHLAARLAPCWAEHPLCLTVLDVAAELHQVLYLRPARTQGILAGQAELVTRLMPAFADLMAADTNRCEHQQARLSAGIGTGLLNGGRR